MSYKNIYVQSVIGDVCSVGDGAHSKVKRVNNGVPYLTSKNIGQGILKLDKFDYISEESFEKLFPQNSKATRRPKTGDVLFGIIGTFGNAYLFKKDDHFGFSSSIGILRPDKARLSSEFLYYVISSNSFKNNHANHNAGSVQGYTNIPTVKGLTIPLPPLENQKRIALILSSLDKKIALNNQINQTLEQMAQALFKIWFVDFDPVKTKMAVWEAGGTVEQANFAAMQVISGKTEAQLDEMKTQQSEQYKELKVTAELFPNAMQESELGDVPVGWEVSEIGKEVTIVGGGTPSTKNPDFWENGALHWTTTKDLSNLSDKILIETSRKVTEKGLTKISSGLLPINTVLMSSRAPVGYLALAKIPVAVNQGYIAMKCEKTLSSEYVIQWCDSIMNDIKQRASGTTFAEISKKNFKVIPLVVPSQVLIKNYSDKASSLYQQIENNLKESQSLTQLRDTLLPKLLSGALVSGGVGGSPTYEPKARAGCEKGA